MNWVKRLESHLKTDGIEKVPAGWMTASRIAVEMGKAKSTISHIVADQVRSGWMERKKFRIQVGDRVVSVPHYRPAPKRK